MPIDLSFSEKRFICVFYNPYNMWGGVNRHGLKANALWQMGVTHYSSFGKQEYLHVTVDTYSVFIMATPSMGQSVLKIVAHLLVCVCVCFNNGPASLH